MIVKPSKGRAIISRQAGNLEIKIPSKKNLAVLGFSAFWLVGWAFGEYHAYNTIISSDTPLLGNLFMLIWITGWTIGGFFVLYSILWISFGIETISINRGELSINKKILGIGFSNSYEMNSIKNIDINIETNKTNKQSLALKNKGSIKFDYGMKTIKFAEDLDEAEAKYIIEKFKMDTRFKEENF